MTLTSTRRRAAAAAAAATLAVAVLALSSPAAALAGPGQRDAAGSASPCGRVSAPPAYRHVIIIMDENQSYSDIIGNPDAPYVNSLARRCGLASGYHNITHDSLPNYLAVTSGLPYQRLLRFDHDCLPSSCQTPAANLFSQAGSWREYAGSMPSNCDKSDSGHYAPKHNPAVYYTGLPGCRADDVPLGTPGGSALLSDFGRERTAPAVAYVTGNLCDDMHGAPGCGRGRVARGDAWLSRWLPRITSTPVYRDGHTVIFLVWDEGTGGRAGERCYRNTSDPSCHVPAIVIAPSVPPGTVVPARFDHYSLLETAEILLGLPRLGRAASAASMKAGFNL